MAEVLLKSGESISAVNTHKIGSTPERRVAGAILVHLVASGFTGSITVVGRARGSSEAFVAIPYIKLHLNGAVADGTYASTAITGTSVILIPATGLDIALDATAVSAGSVAVHYEQAHGNAF